MDEALRALERRARETDAPADEEAWLTALRRNGRAAEGLAVLRARVKDPKVALWAIEDVARVAPTARIGAEVEGEVTPEVARALRSLTPDLDSFASANGTAIDSQDGCWTVVPEGEVRARAAALVGEPDGDRVAAGLLALAGAAARAWTLRSSIEFVEYDEWGKTPYGRSPRGPSHVAVDRLALSAGAWLVGVDRDDRCTFVARRNRR